MEGGLTTNVCFLWFFCHWSQVDDFTLDCFTRLYKLDVLIAEGFGTDWRVHRGVDFGFWVIVWQCKMCRLLLLFHFLIAAG